MSGLKDKLQFQIGNRCGRGRVRKLVYEINRLAIGDCWSKSVLLCSQKENGGIMGVVLVFGCWRSRNSCFWRKGVGYSWEVKVLLRLEV